MSSEYYRSSLSRLESEVQRKSEAKAVLATYEDGSRDNDLTDEDVLRIEDAWHNANTPQVHLGSPRYYIAEIDERGVVIGSSPIDPVAEGYSFCPVRETTQSIYDDEPHVEITGIHYAKTPMEAIKEAKRSGLNTLMSDHENLLKLEVLLSGAIKFEGQDKPRWFPVQYITCGESETLDNVARKWMEENDYEVKE